MTEIEPERTIKVSTYSGYKANERPVSFQIKDLKKEVIEIKERWTGPDKDYFKIKADDERIYILSWNREKDVWSVESL